MERFCWWFECRVGTTARVPQSPEKQFRIDSPKAKAKLKLHPQNTAGGIKKTKNSDGNISGEGGIREVGIGKDMERLCWWLECRVGAIARVQQSPEKIG